MNIDVTGNEDGISTEIKSAGGAGQLKQVTMVGYGAGTVLGDFVWAIFNAFFLFFMTGQLGVNPATGGAIISVATIVCAFSVPMMGIFSDTRTWKHGRRGPFILWGGLALAVTFVLPFVDFGLSGSALVAYLFVMVILLQFAYGAQTAPYGALLAELTMDYDQRTILTTIRGMYTGIVGVVGFSFPLAAVAAFIGWFGITERNAWTLMVVVVAAVGFALNLFCWASTKRHELMPPINPEKLSEILLAAFKNRTFRFVAVMYAVNYIGQAIFNLIGIYFLADYLGMSEATMSLFFLVTGLSALVWVPLNGWIAHKLDKRRAMYIAGLVTLLSCLLMLLITPENAWLMWVLSITATMGMMGAIVIPMAMVADCAEIDEYKSGQRREGLFYSASIMLQLLFAAGAIWVAGMVLTWTGYDGTAMVQSPGAIWGIRLLVTVPMSVMALLTVIFAWRIPLTREKHEAVLAAIKAKKKGQFVDESTFADLF